MEQTCFCHDCSAAQCVESTHCCNGISIGPPLMFGPICCQCVPTISYHNICVGEKIRIQICASVQVR